MGLAASQGRYLCLTARMSDLVYEGQQISQQRMALAKETTAAANEYNDAISNRILQANIIGEDGTVQSQQLTYATLTSKDPFTGLGMRLVDLDGNVVVPKKAYTLTVSSTADDGSETTEAFSSSAAFITAYMTDLDQEEADKMGSWSLEGVMQYYQEQYANANPNLTLTLTSNIDESLKTDKGSYLFDDNCNDPEYLQEMLTTGQWLIQEPSTTADDGWEEVVWQGSTKISDVLDTSDDAAAEAKYEAAMKELQRQDKLLELRLEEVQTEESAVEKEIDSIKDVISKNIEDSFGTFA